MLWWRWDDLIRTRVERALHGYGLQGYQGTLHRLVQVDRLASLFRADHPRDAQLGLDAARAVLAHVEAGKTNEAALAFETMRYYVMRNLHDANVDVDRIAYYLSTATMDGAVEHGKMLRRLDQEWLRRQTPAWRKWRAEEDAKTDDLIKRLERTAKNDRDMIHSNRNNQKTEPPAGASGVPAAHP